MEAGTPSLLYCNLSSEVEWQTLVVWLVVKLVQAIMLVVQQNDLPDQPDQWLQH